MLVKEYLTASLSKFDLSESDIDLIMINQNLLNDEVDVKLAKTAMYNEFSSLIPLMDLSEGTMSIRWNFSAIKLWYSLLAKELGKEDVLSSLEDKSVEVTDRSYLF